MLETDWIKIGLEVSGMVVVGLSAFFTVKAEIKVLANTIDRIEVQVGKIADIIADQRVMDSRLLNAEQDIRDLQRGEGRVIPLTRGAYEHGGKS